MMLSIDKYKELLVTNIRNKLIDKQNILISLAPLIIGNNYDRIFEAILLELVCDFSIKEISPLIYLGLKHDIISDAFLMNDAILSTYKSRKKTYNSLRRSTIYDRRHTRSYSVPILSKSHTKLQLYESYNDIRPNQLSLYLHYRFLNIIGDITNSDLLTTIMKEYAINSMQSLSKFTDDITKYFRNIGDIGYTMEVIKHLIDIGNYHIIGAIITVIDNNNKRINNMVKELSNIVLSTSYDQFMKKVDNIMAIPYIGIIMVDIRKYWELSNININDWWYYMELICRLLEKFDKIRDNNEPNYHYIITSNMDKLFNKIIMGTMNPYDTKIVDWNTDCVSKYITNVLITNNRIYDNINEVITKIIDNNITDISKCTINDLLDIGISYRVSDRILDKLNNDTNIDCIHDLCKILHNIGLSQYIDAFQYHQITPNMIHNLTKEDFNILGVSDNHISKIMSNIKKHNNKYVKYYNWNNEELIKWLQDNNYSKHTIKKFRKNKITGIILRDMNISKLVQYGIDKIGLQQRILLLNNGKYTLRSKSYPSNNINIPYDITIINNGITNIITFDTKPHYRLFLSHINTKYIGITSIKYNDINICDSESWYDFLELNDIHNIPIEIQSYNFSIFDNSDHNIYIEENNNIVYSNISDYDTIDTNKSTKISLNIDGRILVLHSIPK